MIAATALALVLSSSAQDDSVSTHEAKTAVLLPSGRTLTLTGEWTVERTLFGEHALLLGHAHLNVVEPGTSSEREVVPYGKLEVLSGWPVIGQDGRTCYKWLDDRRQLAAIDLTEGSVLTLTDLPRRGKFFGRKHMDGSPVYQGPAAIEDVDSNRVWFVVNRGGDDDGGWLRGVDRTAGKSPIASEVRITKGSIQSWVYSAKRKRVFALVLEEGHIGLYSVGLDRTAPRHLAMPRGSLDRVRLSPDEDRLLFERSYVDPEVVRNASPEQAAKGFLASPDGGFAILDLDTAEVTEGPARGHEAVFTPDGTEVIYQFRWELRRWDVATGRDVVIAAVSPGAEPLKDSPSNFAFPVWSPDGRTFVTNVGENGCSQVIDLAGRRIFLGPGSAGWDFAWAPAGLKIKKG